MNEEQDLDYFYVKNLLRNMEEKYGLKVFLEMEVHSNSLSLLQM